MGNKATKASNSSIQGEQSNPSVQGELSVQLPTPFNKELVSSTKLFQMVGYGLVELTKDENWIEDHLTEILYQGQKVSFYIDDHRLCYSGILDTFYHNESFQIPSAEALK